MEWISLWNPPDLGHKIDGNKESFGIFDKDAAIPPLHEIET